MGCLVALVLLGACQRDVVEVAVASEAPVHLEAPVHEAPAAVEATLGYVERVQGGEPEARLPLVVAIHGLGDRPERFVHLLDGLDVPVRVIAPRAPAERAGGFSWFPGRPADRELSALVAGAHASAAALAELIVSVRATRPTCGAPIVTGFSQGGLLTLALAVHHPEAVGTAFAVGGWLPPAMWPEAKAAAVRFPPIRALHGEQDALVPLAGTELGNRHLATLGFDIETRVYAGVGHTIPPEMRTDLHELIRQAAASRCATGE